MKTSDTDGTAGVDVRHDVTLGCPFRFPLTGTDERRIMLTSLHTRTASSGPPRSPRGTGASPIGIRGTRRLPPPRSTGPTYRPAWPSGDGHNPDDTARPARDP